MDTLFISDLHLSADNSAIVARFLDFLDKRAVEAGALYILGDLFDVWVGDDDRADPIVPVTQALAKLSASGVAVHLLHGNRDFLLGEGFATAAGLQLLPECHVIELLGTSTLLMHGDLLCVDDLAYQEARRHLRSPEQIAQFGALPLEQRRGVAAEYRRRSGEAISMNPEHIMDVNRDAVTASLRKFGAKQLIHGHTHRPGRFPIPGLCSDAVRYVLPAWTAGEGGYLVAGAEAGLRLETW